MRAVTKHKRDPVAAVIQVVYLVVRKSVEEESRLHVLDLQDEVSITSTRCCSYNVFVEREWYEDDYSEEVHHSANRAHSLWTGCE